MASVPGEPRARRTHARRSCELCKVRKTRCELPDLDVPSSSTPLAPEKSCHRCRVLVLPCVVDDSRMKKRKKRDDTSARGGGTTTAIGSRPSVASTSTKAADNANEPSTKRPRGGAGGQNGQGGSGSSQPTQDERLQAQARTNPVNHTVDFSPAFPVTADPPSNQLWESSSGQESEPKPASQRHTVRLHGRPLSLTSAMLSVASRQMFKGLKRKIVVVDDLDLDTTVDHTLRNRLAPGYAQLRTFHPHLQPLDELFSMSRNSVDPSVILLAASALYVTSQSLPDDTDAKRMRVALGPSIGHLQHHILVQQPFSFHAIQALEILSLHAPFAPVLPFQLTDPRTLAPARGLSGIATNISVSLNFQSLVNCGIDRWTNPDFWLWLGMCAGAAQMSLEDERPRKLAILTDARSASASFVAPESDGLWSSAATSDDPAELLGKLAVCDRLARLEELHDGIGRLRGTLETTAAVPNFNAVQTILDEFEYFTRRMTAIDKRYEEILAIISPPLELSSAWAAYRTIRRRFEFMKEYMTGFQALVALHFLPGSAIAIPGLPQGLGTYQMVHYALSRSNDPADIIFAYSTRSTGADELRRVSSLRQELAEQQLLSFIDVSQSVMASDRRPADIIPLHDVVAIVVESCKALVEGQSSKLSYLRTIYGLPTAVSKPGWLRTLSQVSTVLRSMGLLCVDSESSGGESIANGCSNLVGSMARALTEWISIVEREANSSQSHGQSDPLGGGLVHASPTQASATAQFSQQQSRPHTAIGVSGPQNMVGGVAAGFQSYMPTSDRWMASDEPDGGLPPGSAGGPHPPPPHVAPGGHVIQQSGDHPGPRDRQQGGYQPPQGLPQPHPGQMSHHPNPEAQESGSFDHILSEMFGYGYSAVGGQQAQAQAQAHHAQTSTHHLAPPSPYQQHQQHTQHPHQTHSQLSPAPRVTHDPHAPPHHPPPPPHHHPHHGAPPQQAPLPQHQHAHHVPIIPGQGFMDNKSQ